MSLNCKIGNFLGGPQILSETLPGYASRPLCKSEECLNVDLGTKYRYCPLEGNVPRLFTVKGMEPARFLDDQDLGPSAFWVNRRQISDDADWTLPTGPRRRVVECNVDRLFRSFGNSGIQNAK